MVVLWVEREERCSGSKWYRIATKKSMPILNNGFLLRRDLAASIFTRLMDTNLQAKVLYIRRFLEQELRCPHESLETLSILREASHVSLATIGENNGINQKNARLNIRF